MLELRTVDANESELCARLGEIVPANDIQPLGPSLEDVFVQLTTAEQGAP